MPMDRTPATRREPRVLGAVWRRLLRGEPVGPVTIGMATGLTPEEVEAALAALDAAGALYQRDGRVIAAYPLSGIPTRHRLIVRHATAYANCAVDALAVPFMVDDPVTIDSSCVQCGVAITVQMGGGHILATRPEAPAVFYLKLGDCCEAGPAVLTRCPSINFFCSADHAAQWQAMRADRPGTVLTLAEAIARAQERFASVVRAYCGGDVPLAELARRL